MFSLKTLIIACSFYLPFAFAGTGVTPPNPLIPVLELAGKDLAAVEKVVGKSEACDKVKYGQLCVFGSAGLEIVFIDGKADWITYNNPANLLYKAQSITNFGFELTDPTRQNEFSMEWKGINGMKSVTFFPNGEVIAYVLVKSKTD